MTPFELTGFLMGKLATRQQVLLEAVLADPGLTVRHHSFLSVAASRPDFNQQQVGEALGLDRTTAMRVADELEKLGLIERNRGLSDRRTLRIRVTPLARQKLQYFYGASRVAEEVFLRGLSAQEAKLLKDLLAKLYRSLEAEKYSDRPAETQPVADCR